MAWNHQLDLYFMESKDRLFFGVDQRSKVLGNHSFAKKWSVLPTQEQARKKTLKEIIPNYILHAYGLLATYVKTWKMVTFQGTCRYLNIYVIHWGSWDWRAGFQVENLFVDIPQEDNPQISKKHLIYVYLLHWSIHAFVGCFTLIHAISPPKPWKIMVLAT